LKILVCWSSLGYEESKYGDKLMDGKDGPLSRGITGKLVKFLWFGGGKEDVYISYLWHEL
jgi:hypothetical protein